MQGIVANLNVAFNKMSNVIAAFNIDPQHMTQVIDLIHDLTFNIVRHNQHSFTSKLASAVRFNLWNAPTPLPTVPLPREYSGDAEKELEAVYGVKAPTTMKTF